VRCAGAFGVFLVEKDFIGEATEQVMIGHVVKFHLNVPEPQSKIVGKVNRAAEGDVSHKGKSLFQWLPRTMPDLARSFCKA
jgi:hypothetical protein